MYLTILSSLLAVTIGFPHRDNGYMCHGPPDRGPCNKKIWKWTFDRNTRTCILFHWSGCGGNEYNRFNTEIECLRTCALIKREFVLI